jgi:hypothetical protein
VTSDFQREFQPGENLTDFIVEFARDEPAFGFLNLDQAAGKGLQLLAPVLYLLERNYSATATF